MRVAAPARPWAATTAGRLLRGAVAALIAVGLAVAAHVTAGGMAPSVLVSVIGFLLVWRVAWGCAGRRVSFTRIAGLVVCAQAGLHLAFAMSAPAGHHHHPVHPVVMGTLSQPAGGPGLDLLPGGASMLAAHLAAALVLAGWLAVGERLLWRVASGAARVAASGLARLLRRGGARHVLRAHRPLPIFTAADQVRRWEPLRHMIPRRGPPTLLPVT
ncbi:hypothetical protein [Frankia sp. KB5]|uniref:hypothetical protein n=1 Tax=Frankia sp. KB5 TaxID=683318 RepID=UPI000A2288AC|nr:hypothetical protein [Frankia sp. KB5]ORT53456.1 hypothetical protein KBI5_06955 [Frankia sp. KB5]